MYFHLLIQREKDKGMNNTYNRCTYSFKKSTKAFFRINIPHHIHYTHRTISILLLKMKIISIVKYLRLHSCSHNNQRISSNGNSSASNSSTHRIQPKFRLIPLTPKHSFIILFLTQTRFNLFINRKVQSIRNRYGHHSKSISSIHLPKSLRFINLINLINSILMPLSCNLILNLGPSLHNIQWVHRSL